jgi:hypothetical protein
MQAAVSAAVAEANEKTRPPSVVETPQQSDEGAHDNGYEVSTRGRTPTDVVRAYDAAEH